MSTISEIATELLHHGYKLIVFDGPDYEIRGIETNEVCWDWENSGVPLSEFDVEQFLDGCGRWVH